MIMVMFEVVAKCCFHNHNHIEITISIWLWLCLKLLLNVVFKVCCSSFSIIFFFRPKSKKLKSFWYIQVRPTMQLSYHVLTMFQTIQLKEDTILNLETELQLSSFKVNPDVLLLDFFSGHSLLCFLAYFIIIQKNVKIYHSSIENCQFKNLQCLVIQSQREQFFSISKTKN